MTELQPGSFIFMDLDYGRIGGPDGDEYRDFKNALTVMTTVVSTPPGFAIVDGGYKAFSTDRPFTPKPLDLRRALNTGGPAMNMAASICRRPHGS